VFRSARVNDEFLGLKVVTQQSSGWIVLDPPPSEARNGVLFVDRAPMGSAEKLVFELTEAILRPSMSFAGRSKHRPSTAPEMSCSALTAKLISAP
jgi:hypothetical protein